MSGFWRIKRPPKHTKQEKRLMEKEERILCLSRAREEIKSQLTKKCSFADCPIDNLWKFYLMTSRSEKGVNFLLLQREID